MADYPMLLTWAEDPGGLQAVLESRASGLCERWPRLTLWQGKALAAAEARLAGFAELERAMTAEEAFAAERDPMAWGDLAEWQATEAGRVSDAWQDEERESFCGWLIDWSEDRAALLTAEAVTEAGSVEALAAQIAGQ